MKFNIDEVKALIVWAKSERIQSLTVSAKGDISVQFSSLAYVGEYPEVSDKIDTNVPSTADDEDLLFHSARP